MSDEDLPQFDPTSIGNLARAFGKVSHEDVEQAAACASEGKYLGECLVELDKISNQELERLLKKQADLRDERASLKDARQLTDYVLDRLDEFCRR